MAVRQGGKSAIGNFIVLAIIAFGVWVGIQYIPQKIEHGTVQSVLDKVEQSHHAYGLQNVDAVWKTIDKQLNVNEMRDMRQNFEVTRTGSGITVNASYERDLNLIVTTKVMRYDDSVILN